MKARIIISAALLTLVSAELLFAERLEAHADLQPQVEYNVQHLAQQIRRALAGFAGSSSTPRAEVSEEMRSHPLVAGLVARLASKITFTTGRDTLEVENATTLIQADQKKKAPRGGPARP